MVRKQAEKQRARNLLLSKLKKTTTTYFKDEGHVVSEFITNIVWGNGYSTRFLFKSSRLREKRFLPDQGLLDRIHVVVPFL